MTMQRAREMTKTLDYVVDFSAEVPVAEGAERSESTATCRLRLFAPTRRSRTPIARKNSLAPILLLCWNLAQESSATQEWLEEYSRVIHSGVIGMERPATLFEQVIQGEKETIRQVLLPEERSGDRKTSFQSIARSEVERIIGESLDAPGMQITTAVKPKLDSESACALLGQSNLDWLAEGIHQQAIAIGETAVREPILDEQMEYSGYHGCLSICRVRVYNSKTDSESAKRPHIVVFTELYENPGTSVTNRIEHLATLLYKRLGRPEPEPIWIEHYPNRGVYCKTKNRWQFPENLAFVELERDKNGAFRRPSWKSVSRMAVEILIGQRFGE